MNNSVGPYGPVGENNSWDVQAARDEAAEQAYRRNKVAADADARRTAKMDLLYRHESDGAVYQDGENCLHLGYERNGKLYVFGTVDFSTRSVIFGPLRIAGCYMVKWQPFSQVFDSIRKFRMTAPKGCI